MAKTKVRPHTRKGKRVRAHSRKLDPRKGGRRVTRGLRAARNRKYAAGAALAAGGAAELAGWGLARVLAAAALATGLLLIGAGVQMRRSAK